MKWIVLKAISETERGKEQEDSKEIPQNPNKRERKEKKTWREKRERGVILRVGTALGLGMFMGLGWAQSPVGIGVELKDSELSSVVGAAAGEWRWPEGDMPMSLQRGRLGLSEREKGVKEEWSSFEKEWIARGGSDAVRALRGDASEVTRTEGELMRQTGAEFVSPLRLLGGPNGGGAVTLNGMSNQSVLWVWAR